MALTPKLLQQGAAGSARANYIEDVFSTYVFTGTGSTLSITNGIDLSGKGGLVWLKSRSMLGPPSLFDTSRGANNVLWSRENSAQSTGWGGLTSFNSNGFTLDSNGNINGSGDSTVGWTFREQAKFFDVVTYTGNGAASRNISHALGSKPGFVVLKRTDSTGNWFVAAWTGTTFRIGTDALPFALNSTNAYNTQNGAAATSTTFDPNEVTLSSNYGVTPSNANINGATYVAYLFAHNAGGFGLTGSDNVITCGSYTGNGSTTGPTVNLGYEPQWLMVKRTDDIESWNIVDNMRGLSVGDTSTTSHSPRLRADLGNAEQASGWVIPTATGFQLYGVNAAAGSYNASGGTYIYIAIRRGPMKVPTSGTSVFAPALGTSASTIPTFVTNFPVDLGFYHSRANVADWFLSSRLQGGGTLYTNATYAEAAPDANYTFDSNTGWGKNFNSDKASSNFRRAPGFFDIVCYTGNGVDGRTINHSLGVAPNLIIVKDRTLSGTNWVVGGSVMGYENLKINSTNGSNNGGAHIAPPHTATTFDVYNAGGDAVSSPAADRCNVSSSNYVAWLFATCAGVSKVGSYTGTATTNQIDCGFTAGARFILIKRRDSTGDWYVWDTARGIISGNDPYLLMNSTAAEVTNTDYIDSYSPGFELSSTAPAAINANGGTYIFLAIA